MSGRVDPEAVGITPEMGAFAEFVGFTFADDARRDSVEQEIAATKGVAFALAALELAGALRPEVSVEEIEEAFIMTIDLYNDVQSLAWLRDQAASKLKHAYGVDMNASFVYPESVGMYDEYHNQAQWDAVRAADFTEDEIVAIYTTSSEDLTDRELEAGEYFVDLYHSPTVAEQAKKQVIQSKIAGWLKVMAAAEPIEQMDQNELLRMASPGNLTPDEEGLRNLRRSQAKKYGAEAIQ